MLAKKKKLRCRTEFRAVVYIKEKLAYKIDLHVLGMPPAFILSHDQTLKFMYHTGAVE